MEITGIPTEDKIESTVIRRKDGAGSVFFKIKNVVDEANIAIPNKGRNLK